MKAARAPKRPPRKGGYVAVVCRYSAEGAEAELLHALDDATHGVHENCCDSEKKTLLHHAVAGGHLNIVRLLLDRPKTNVFALDSRGNSALHAACAAAAKQHRGSEPDCVAIVDQLLTHVYIRYRNAGLLRAMELRNSNGKSLIDVVRDGGGEARDRGPLVRSLMQRLSQARKADEFFAAARQGDVPLVESLLQCGIPADVQDGDFWTALHHAALSGRIDVAETCLRAGATVDLADNKMCTPLHIASRYGRQDVCTALLQSGAAVNAVDESGSTPLHFACRTGNAAVAMLLKRYDGDANWRNAFDQTPMDLARRTGNDDLARQLEGESHPERTPQACGVD